MNTVNTKAVATLALAALLAGGTTAYAEDSRLLNESDAQSTLREFGRLIVESLIERKRRRNDRVSEAPRPKSPRDGARLEQASPLVNLLWTEVAGAHVYQVEYECFGSVALGRWDSDAGRPPQRIDGVRGTYVDVPFPNRQTGRWRVRGVGKGYAGTWSDWHHFSYRYVGYADAMRPEHDPYAVPDQFLDRDGYGDPYAAPEQPPFRDGYPAPYPAPAPQYSYGPADGTQAWHGGGDAGRGAPANARSLTRERGVAADGCDPLVMGRCRLGQAGGGPCSSAPAVRTGRCATRRSAPRRRR